MICFASLQVFMALCYCTYIIINSVLLGCLKYLYITVIFIAASASLSTYLEKVKCVFLIIVLSVICQHGDINL